MDFITHKAVHVFQRRMRVKVNVDIGVVHTRRKEGRQHPSNGLDGAVIGGRSDSDEGSRGRLLELLEQGWVRPTEVLSQQDVLVEADRGQLS